MNGPQRPRILWGLLVICLSLGLLPLWTVAEQTITLEVNEATLRNGMKVLVLERHTSPTVAVNLVFRVGSVNERPGLTGISHILEHMLFKGTETIGTKDYAKEKPILDKIDTLMKQLIELRQQKTTQSSDRPTVADQEIKVLKTQLDELLKIHRTYRIINELQMIYRRNGAVGLNASTAPEITRYYCELPANKLELWAWLESDRLTHPVWREFYQEKDVIMEERRWHSEADPRGFLRERFKATAYLAHPLRWPIIGWSSDIESITKEKVNKWFQTYYAPNNAIAVIVGDVNLDDVLTLMREYFEPIPARAPPAPVTTIEPPQSGERRVQVEFDAQPSLRLGYHTTTIGHPNDYTLDIISELLSGGRTSRFYRKLVLGKNLPDGQAGLPAGQAGLCLDIETYNDVGKYPGLFVISATPRHPHTPAEIEQVIYNELDLLKQKPVPEPELARVKKRLKASFLRGLTSNSGLALRLGYYEALYDWRYILDISDKWNAVTVQDIQSVARKYFVSSNRTVATLVRKATPADRKKR